MSLHEYHYSLKLSRNDPPFYALIMAAMRKADIDNLTMLRAAFPGIFRELQRRYNAPLGVLPEEEADVDMEKLQEALKNL